MLELLLQTAVLSIHSNKAIFLNVSIQLHGEARDKNNKNPDF